MLKCQFDHILTYGINSYGVDHDEFTRIIDNHLAESKYIQEKLIVSLINNINSSSTSMNTCNNEHLNWYENKIIWYENRLNIIKMRFDNNKIPEIINNRNTKLNSWKSIEKLVHKSKKR